VSPVAQPADAWSLSSSEPVISPDEQVVVGGTVAAEDHQRMLKAIQIRSGDLPTI
jgi:hypothetical protein